MRYIFCTDSAFIPPALCISVTGEEAFPERFIKSSLKTLSVSSGMKYALNRVVMRHDEIEETKPLRIPMRVSSGTCNEVPS